MHILITVCSLLAAWRWADWSRFHSFLATILYMTAMDLLYFFLATDYPLWIVKSDIGMMTKSEVALLYAFIVFPCTAMLFLSNYPDTIRKQFLHIGKWIIIYISVEWLGFKLGVIYYEHGWTIGWSLLFLIVMFPMLRLHFKRPVLAYIASIFVIIFLLNWFDVPWKNVL
jgi:hypothetical protein